jgi:phosphatidylserine/phosphatidylglycerophosphate/cardiolipin synthase-like enzyme
MEKFLTHPGVRFLLNPDGVFHPKVYLFEKAGRKWECVIGSPNFTQSALTANDEMEVLLTDEDHGADEALVGVKTAITEYWQKASQISRDKWEAYQEIWKRKRPIVKNLQGKFGNPEDEDADDHGKVPLDVDILQVGWAEYYEKVKAEKPSPYGFMLPKNL